MLEKENKDNNYLAKIRNIGIMAHIDAGKTTTTERILYHAGKIHKIGEVHEGEAQMDWMKQEQERGITITSAATTVFWQGQQVNIIDTPGHVDFTAEVERSLRVLDGGIVVIDGKEGVEAQTETVWNQADKYQIPRLVFINKMDSMDSAENVENRFVACCQSLEERLGAKLLVCQFPIGGNQGIEGVIDLVEEKVYYFQKGDRKENYQIKEVPANLHEKAQIYRQNLLEKIIPYDEELGLKYLEGQLLFSQEIKKLIRKMVISGEYFAVFCGSAYKHIGVKLLLDGVIDYLPSPLDRNQITVFSNQEEKIISTLDYPQPLALAFKVMNLSFAKLTFIRVYCGKISANSYVYNINKGEKERVSRLVRMHANKQEEVSEVKMGDIAAVIGLKYTATGDTLCGEKQEILLEQISFAEPVISLAVEPKTKKDQDELSKGLRSLSEEDPTFRYHYNSETNEMIISGMGELHLEVLVERLKSEFGVEIKVSKPQVAYRETITKKVENVEAWYKKKTGGRGHDARIWITFEPNEKGKGFEFIDVKKGQDMSNKDAEEVKEGLEEAMLSGLLLGCPLLDMKATLLGGKRHEVDTQSGDFKMAAISAFRGNGMEEREKKAQDLGAVLLEPIMKLEVSNIPEEYYGTVLASVTSKQGIVESVEKKKVNYLLKAKIPLAETFGYSTALRSLTEGRAAHSLQFSHYQEVPAQKAEELLKKR